MKINSWDSPVIASNAESVLTLVTAHGRQKSYARQIRRKYGLTSLLQTSLAQDGRSCVIFGVKTEVICLSLNTLGHLDEKARARTPEPEQRAYLGGSVLPGLILAAVSAKYCSAGRATAGDLILSDSIPRISLYINLL